MGGGDVDPRVAAAITWSDTHVVITHAVITHHSFDVDRRIPLTAPALLIAVLLPSRCCANGVRRLRVAGARGGRAHARRHTVQQVQ